MSYKYGCKPGGHLDCMLMITATGRWQYCHKLKSRCTKSPGVAISPDLIDHSTPITVHRQCALHASIAQDATCSVSKTFRKTLTSPLSQTIDGGLQWTAAPAVSRRPRRQRQTARTTTVHIISSIDQSLGR